MKPDPTILAEARSINSSRWLSLFVKNGDASELALFLAGMAVVAGMLLTIGAMKP